MFSSICGLYPLNSNENPMPGWNHQARLWALPTDRPLREGALSPGEQPSLRGW